MSRPLRRLILLGLLLDYTYGEARGHNYSIANDRYLAYRCLRHFARNIGGVMPSPRCPCGQPLGDELLVKIRCDAWGANLYYLAFGDLPAAVAHGRGGHRPKPLAEER